MLRKFETYNIPTIPNVTLTLNDIMVELFQYTLYTGTKNRHVKGKLFAIIPTNNYEIDELRHVNYV